MVVLSVEMCDRSNFIVACWFLLGNDEMSRCRSHADKKDCKQRSRTVACMGVVSLFDL